MFIDNAKEFLIDLDKFPVKDKQDYFTEKEESELIISHLIKKNCVIQDVTQLEEGERYKAIIDEDLYGYVKVLEVIDDYSFIGMGKDGYARPYTLSKINHEDIIGRKN